MTTDMDSLDDLTIGEVFRGSDEQTVTEFYQGLRALVDRTKNRTRQEQYQAEQAQAEAYYKKVLGDGVGVQAVSYAREQTRARYPGFRSGVTENEYQEAQSKSAMRQAEQGDLLESYRNEVDACDGLDDKLEVRRKYRQLGLDL